MQSELDRLLSLQYPTREDMRSIISLQGKRIAELEEAKILQSGEAPAQQLKAAIDLVREAAHVHLTGFAEFTVFEMHLENIEQRAAV